MLSFIHQRAFHCSESIEGYSSDRVDWIRCSINIFRILCLIKKHTMQMFILGINLFQYISSRYVYLWHSCLKTVYLCLCTSVHVRSLCSFAHSTNKTLEFLNAKLCVSVPLVTAMRYIQSDIIFQAKCLRKRLKWEKNNQIGLLLFIMFTFSSVDH